MEIRTELEIAAPASDVWRVLTDLPRYGEWNPFITEIAGDLVENGKLRVLLSLPEGRDLRIMPRLLRCDENRELCWRGHLLFPGLFDGEHFFRLEELTPRRTRFVYMNNALKRHVEEML